MPATATPAPTLTDVGGTLFFTAYDGTHGEELWKSDGTEAGTVLVKNIRPGDYGSELHPSLTDVGGTLFFTAIRRHPRRRSCGSPDGTEAGTVMVKNIDPGARSSDPSDLTGVGATLFFAADDGTHGQELWKSDGTEAGTVLVKDINAGGKFRVASRGTANTRTGTLRVKVAVAGPGTLVVRPVDGSRVQGSVRHLASAGPTTITLRPTRAGMRILRRVGRLRVKARFTFTPCGGTGSSVIRRYTLRMR